MLSKPPDTVAVASLQTHRLILTVPNEGPAEVTSNLPRAAVAEVLRTIATHYGPEPAADTTCTHQAWEQHGTARRCADCREPLPDAEQPADTTAADIADALCFNADADSPTLYCLRDALVTMPGTTPAGALDAARVLLAAHARALAELLHGEVLADRERNPGGGENHRNHAYRAGMMSARQIIGRYADDLDAQAAGGES